MTVAVADATEHTKNGLFAHVPALDGLRAIAVLSVIGYHFDLFGLRGGFLGVDLFFVLSGFLITSLLLAEGDKTGQIDLRSFWLRRAKRLMPAVLVLLVGVSIWAALEADPLQLDSIRLDLLAMLGYVANWRFIASGQSYFALFTEASPVRHAWSLAIEEQFYLVWPLLFVILYKTKKKWVIFAFAAVATVASTTLLITLYQPGNPSRVYYGTDTRASQLLIGVLLAVLASTGRLHLKNLTANLVSLVALTAVIASMFIINDQQDFLYRGGLVGFAVVAAIAVFASTQLRSGPINAILCLPPVQYIGKISYGLYLWHWPVQIAISEHRTDISGWWLTLARLGATFVITVASYHFIEMPIRHSKWPGWLTWRSLAIGATAAAVVAGIILVGTAGAQEKPAYLTTDPGEVIDFTQTTITQTTIAPGSTVTTVAPDSTVTTIASGSTVTTAPSPVPLGNVVLIGDSLAASMQTGLATVAAKRGISFSAATRPGCAVIRGLPTDNGKLIGIGQPCVDGLEKYITQNILGKDPDSILWVSSWEAGSRMVNGVNYESGTPKHQEMLMSEFKYIIDRLTVNGAHVFFLTIPPPTDDNELGMYLTDKLRIANEGLEEAYYRYAALHPTQVAVIDLSSIACPSGIPCPAVVDGVRLRPRDGRHFSDQGAAWVAPKLFDELEHANLQFSR